jgi:asparagine synthase (glutamine-hydrolysing)
MFAFAILNVQASMLFLARDFFGIKPLYYAQTGSCLAFASEIQPLLRVPGVQRRTNPGRLYEYLRFGRTDHGGETLFEDIRQLPAAHYAEIPLSKPAPVLPVNYWTVEIGQTDDMSFAQAAERLREHFLENIRLHLRSDVAVGAAFSGGVDSSAIVAAVRHVEPELEVRAFSYVADDPALSEEKWMDEASRRCQFSVHKISAGPAGLLTDFGRLVSAQGEPFGSTSILAQYRVFRAASEAGIKVMLDGQGADELLGGYSLFVAARLASLFREGRWLEAQRFARRASKLPGNDALWIHAGEFLVPSFLQDSLRRFFGKQGMPPWLNASWFAARSIKGAIPRRGKGRDVLRESLRDALQRASLPALLRYEDRNSMSHSIESRVPFLTPGLAQFVLSLPEEFIVAADGTRKSVFREAMRGIVPDVILDRRDKVPFQTPELQWLAKRREWVEQVFRRAVATGIAPLNMTAVWSEWAGILDGKRPFDFRVWRWLNLIEWAERVEARFD